MEATRHVHAGDVNAGLSALGAPWRRLRALFGAKKRRRLAATPPQLPRQRDAADVKMWRLTMDLVDEPLSTSFAATKRRRMLTMHARGAQGDAADAVPRLASVAEGPPMPGAWYLALCSARQAQHDLGNDLEQRRRSIIETGPAAAAPAAASDDPNRTRSPLEDLEPSVRAHAPGNPSGADTERTTPSPTSETASYEPPADAAAAQLAPVVVEHEFAPLYRDSSGRLVRPPFIHLDPRERYHLLQLKRLVEASEYLQSRLKHMVDPAETRSKATSTGVETATQTIDRRYLQATLRLSRRRGEPARKRLKRNSGGYFVGDFDYDVHAPPPKSAPGADLKGYLGHVTVPAAAAGTGGGQAAKSTAQRFGMDEVLRGKKEKLELDREYVEMTKRREQPANAPARAPAEVAAPPQESPQAPPPAPEPTKRPREDSLVPALPKFHFGAKAPESALDAPSIQFGQPEKPLSGPGNTATAKPPAPAFTFGTKPQSLPTVQPPAGLGSLADAAKTDAPKFSFGTDPAKPSPKFSFGAPAKSNESSGLSIGDLEKSSGPKFSFGASEPSKPSTGTPKFLFGAADLSTGALADAKLAADTPKFSFGVKPADAPKVPLEDAKPADSAKISFGDGKPADAPNNSFGAKPANAPKFSFGAKPADAPKVPIDDTKSTNSPNFSFGSAPPKPTPAFSFGTSTAEPKPATPAPSLFGSSTPTPSTTATGDAAKGASTPAFAFGSDASAAKPASQPAFSFGTAPAKDATPTFSVGGEKSEPPGLPKPFTFGLKPSTPANAMASAPVSSAPSAINFGAANTNKSFSFGSSSAPAPFAKLETPQPPAFSFGGSPAPLAPFGSPAAALAFGGTSTGFGAQPAFLLGKPAQPLISQSNPNSREASPAFNFNQTPPTAVSAGFTQGSIQPLLVPNINFAGATSDPASIFLSTTPPPTTGTPPMRRKMAQPRSRRR
jgi:nucleoporin NUP1